MTLLSFHWDTSYEIIIREERFGRERGRSRRNRWLEAFEEKGEAEPRTYLDDVGIAKKPSHRRAQSTIETNAHFPT
jgi:hypothetical protein